MDIDTALELIRQAPWCFVVWRLDTGEIVSVEGCEEPGPEVALLPSWGVSSTKAFPSKGRFMQSTMVTKGLLEAEADECQRVIRRRFILEAWARADAEHLVGILERANFQSPYLEPRDADYLLRLLFHIHADELCGPRRDLKKRLHHVLHHVALDRLTNLELAQHLAVLNGNAKRVKALYRHRPAGIRLDHFIVPFGDVRTTDPEVISWLIEVVDSPGLYGPRFDAMVALGKIGPPAGPRAVLTVRKRMTDNSEGVRAVRERVIERITTPPKWWTPCLKCCRGRVLSVGPSLPWPQSCDACLEMGVVLIPKR